MSNLPGGFTPLITASERQEKPLSLSFYALGAPNVTAYLSAGAVESLGFPAFIEVGFDAELGMVAVAVAKETDAGAMRLRRHGSGGRFAGTALARLALPDETGTATFPLKVATMRALVGQIKRGAK